MEEQITVCKSSSKTPDDSESNISETNASFEK